ncbi:MAG: uroporphyrinogen decarboxylase family protein [Rudaea sp.]
MTLAPLDRLKRTLARQPVDRLPVGPYLANWNAQYTGMPFSTYCSEGRAMADALLSGWEQVGHDIIFPDADNYYLAEGFGCQSQLYADNFPTLARPALEDPQQVFALDVPDPHRDGRMPVYLEATRLVARQVGDGAVIRVPGTGPFAVASYFIGVQEFLTEVACIERGIDTTNEAAIERMLDLATEAVIRFGLAQIESGAHILQCGDSLASGSMISPATFRRFVLPHHRRIFKVWKEAGAITALHVCGDNSRMLDLFAETGADIVAIDSKVELGFAKSQIGDRVTLIGNLDPVHVMLEGSELQVQAAAEDCIAAAAHDGGYILGTGCEVPPGTPLENLRTLVRVAHEYRAGDSE